MCGIFGCQSLQPQNLVEKTLQGLKILEYRGYDSAGIAYNATNQLKIIKAVGGLERLANKTTTPPPTNVCIGHTRWATNGAVSVKNSHPHLSADGSIAVVHNGIIENYQQCVTKLAKHGIKLKTPVDTEVIPNILYLLSHNKHNIHKYLQGQYVFCATEQLQNNLFLAKKGSLPLYIGRDQQTIYISSDTLALPQSVNQIIAMEDLETCEIINQQPTFYHNNHPIRKDWQPFNQSFVASDKNGFTTYMEKEINEIPAITQRIITAYQSDPTIRTLQRQFRTQLKTVNCVHLCACGTSYHAAKIIAHIIERELHLRAIAHISSELNATTLLAEPSLAIVISQSGETADTLAAMDILQQQNIPIIALCNVTTSTIAKRSQIVFPLLCGPEIAVASTKVFCAAVLVGCLLINDYNTISCDNLIKYTTKTLRNARKLLPTPSKIPHQIFIIGKGINYTLALEAALKIKEVTYLHCEGYPANELKHGPLSLVDDNTLAIVFGDDSANASAEIQARGGKVVTLLSPDYQHNPLAFVSQIIPAQIFALDLALSLGNNPDKPRNLAKSVTVL
ncbi:MAG: glutamine--fructose-6-phosphate transaminase (isomerizing) [Eubacteriales bacterium]|nr:glutamine--fructose-6-phosphate transaminase (isomerizing) [Eubacteriales bacterium]